MTQADGPVPRRMLLHPGLVSSGATLLMAAFVTDVFYWRSMLFQWNNFSAWLLTGGLLLAALAAVALVLDLLMRRLKIAWLRFAGLTIAVLLSLLNAFVHSRDAYTAVVPEGIVLSGIAAVLLLLVGLIGGWSLESRRSAPLAQTRVSRS